MRVDSRLIGFGVFFLVFGGVLLAARQGAISAELVERAWQLWPLLLIGAGVSIVLEGRAIGAVGGLLISATLGVMAAGLVAGGGFPFGSCGGAADDATAFPAQGGELASDSLVEIDFSCGDLTVESVEGSAWSLEGRSERGTAPDVEQDGSELRLEPGSDRGFFGVGDASPTWTVRLPTASRIDLDVGLNAGSGTVRLEGADLEGVDVAVNAGSLRVDMRGVASLGAFSAAANAGQLVVWLPDIDAEGSVAANAGSIAICRPDGIGLSVVSQGTISSNDFASRGLVQVGDAWQTPDFAAADVQVRLEASANAGSLSLDPPDDCGT